MIKIRSEVAIQDRWNVEAFFPTIADWKEAFSKIAPSEKEPSWEKIASFKGRLGKGPAVLKEALEFLLKLERELTTLYTYAHLRHDEDITDDNNKTAFDKARSALFEYQNKTSWMQPELLALSEETLQQYLNSPLLKDYHFFLEKIFRLKPHTLSAEKEELMAMAAKAMSTPQKAFSAINDADFTFPPVKNSRGEELELTHARYGLYLRDSDRTLRENAFKTYHGKFDRYKNVMGELIAGAVQNHVFQARSRGFKSCLEAALYPYNIPVSVYTSLIKAVRDKIGSHHRYVALRSKLLNLSPIHLYDMHVPLTPSLDLKTPYSEAEDLVIASTAPLGKEYQNALKKGLKDDRWVDRYENKNKRSGAYSSGCYDSMPYILMNYKEILRDVFTLAHEVGHSMHTYLSHANQPYHYADYSIFLAEVASTFNEELLMQQLLKKVQTKDEKIYFINQKIEDIRVTLFRQTMFAEFELKIHELAENDIPLTPKLLSEEYLKLNEFYFGPSVHLDPEINIEWARIPHFYYNFYVFQYATGISAALALADKVLKGGDREREDYLGFLKSGSSQHPIELLQKAGVNMGTPQPVIAAIGKFDHLVDELEALTK